MATASSLRPLAARLRRNGLLLVLLPLFGVLGCADPRVIVLQDPSSGHIVPCGPPPGTPSKDPGAEAQNCAKSYEALGYKRLPIER
jgi:hypothetical protein